MKKKTRKQLIKAIENENMKLWGLIVRDKAQNKSELSGETGVLHAHHIFMRNSNPNLRYDLNNGILLTQGEHFKVHMGLMPELITLLIAKRGQEWYETLMSKKKEPTIHRTLADLQDINETLKSICNNRGIKC